MVINWDILSILVFYVIILFLYFRYKNRFQTQGILLLYRTKLGLRLMDTIALKFPRFVTFLAYAGVFVGFTGMVFILYTLVIETWKLIFVPGTAPALAPLLPGVQIAGAPTLSFWHWILAIFVVAVIHEFSHGVVARLFHVPIKSSGVAFFGPILGAFVEPEETELEKISIWKQISVFAAGPFSNMLSGALVLLVITLIFVPLVSQLYQANGITVTAVVDGYPMNQTGIDVPFTISGVNGNQTLAFVSFLDTLSAAAPGETMLLETNKGNYSVTPVANPDDPTKAFLGVSGLEQEVVLKEQFASLEPLRPVLDWLQLFLIWLFLIHIGIGLFNLLPLGPLDGGRMFYAVAFAIVKDTKKAKRALMLSTTLCLVLIIINFLPWLNKLFTWLFGTFVSLLTFLF